MGCLALLVVIAAAAYLTRSRWEPMLNRQLGRTTTESKWEAVNPSKSTRAREAVESLGRRSGPVYANFSPADLIALMLEGAKGQLPPSVQQPEASVMGDKVRMRALIDLRDMKGLGDLGVLGGLMDKPQRVTFSGTLDIVRPGLAEYRIESAQIGDFPIPTPAIPKLLARFGREARPAGVAANGVGFEVPPYIGDVRVAKGRITLYKAVS
jgi:hypothetical protein